MILQIPSELHPTILTYLRATDLSSLQQTCRTFSNRTLIQDVIQIFASTIYPPELTKGYDTPAISGELPSTYENKPSYESLRNMETLIVARVLSRPEPPLNERSQGCFYVSKAWCKAALKWLEVLEEQRKERFKLQLEAAKEKAAAAAAATVVTTAADARNAKKKHVKKKKQTKKMKKQERRRNRKLSDTSPPWPNVNHDLICEHGFLKRSACTVVGSKNGGGRSNNVNQLSSPGGGTSLSLSSSSSRSSRAKRRLMDKQAWKVLKKLYPEGIQLSSLQGECIQCTMEAEAQKRNIEMKKQKETEERKRPLQNSHVRKFYSRSNRGVPKDCLKFPEGEYENKFAVNVNPMKKFENSRSGSSGSNVGSCPLIPGVYYILPRAWCHKWRKYIKTGEGSRPCAPDSSSCLCDAHRLPLIPPHLEVFLYGETTSLLGTGIDLMSSDCTHLLDGCGSGELFGSPIAATTAASSSSSSSSNIMTIHDLNNTSTPVRTTSAPATSIASASASSSTPRPLPIGFNPVDQKLGGNGRSRSNSHSSFSSPTPDNNGRRSRSGSHTNMASAISTTRVPDQNRNHIDGRSRSDSQTSSSSITGVATLPQSTKQQQQQQSQLQPQQLFDTEMVSTLRASGLSESEIQLQRLAMLQIEEERQHVQQQQQHQYQQYQLEQQQRMRLSRQSSQGQPSTFEPDSSFNSPNLMSPEDIRANLNAKLDYENRVVVEILTEEEYTGLEQWWPGIHSSYALKFAILENNVSCGVVDANGCDRIETEIVWTTSPCRACDATGYHSNHDFVVRNRSRNWVNQSNQKPNYKKKRH